MKNFSPLFALLVLVVMSGCSVAPEYPQQKEALSRQIFSQKASSAIAEAPRPTAKRESSDASDPSVCVGAWCSCDSGEDSK